VGGPPVESASPLPNSVVALARGGALLAPKPASRVARRDIAVFTVSVALWSLREMGAVDFSVSNPARWLPFSSLMVGLRSTLVTDDSIERDLLNQVRMILSGNRYRSDHRVNVRELVREWIIDSTALWPTVGDPYDEVLELGMRQSRNAYLDPERLDSAALRLASGWQVFLHDEPELATRLNSTVSRGIYSAVDRSASE